jgi:hypothetical protein
MQLFDHKFWKKMKNVVYLYLNKTFKTMKVDYICPHCGSHLVCGDHLVLTVDSDNGKKRGLIMMDVRPGNYSYLSHPDLHFEDGEEVDFYCPVFRKNLKVPEINDKLVRLIMVDETGKEFDVYFSRVAGEKSTFKIDKQDVIEHYGEDASGYVSYFTSQLKKQMQ